MINTLRLIQAAAIIAQITGSNVTAIQFEDGSGCKFNYQLNGSSTWTYTDLTGKL